MRKVLRRALGLALLLGVVGLADDGLLAYASGSPGRGGSASTARRSWSWRWRGFGLTVEIPEALAPRAAQRPPPEAIPTQDGGGPLGQLILRPPPAVTVTKRDPDRALDAVRAFWSRRAGAATAAAPPSGPVLPAVSLAREVESHAWYHTIDLPGGIVTRGIYDHRPLVPHYGIPADLRGQRVLDVATNDGFWAFEFERRGADVVAVDVDRGSSHDFPPPVKEALVREGLDWSTGAGFAIAHRALGSKVRRVVASVYDLDPQTMGVFDLVHSGDVLLHLENPIAALRRIRAVTSQMALIADTVWLGGRAPRAHPHVIIYRGGWSSVTWWELSVDAVAQMVMDAGFSDVRVLGLYNLAPTDGHTGPWRAIFQATA